MTKGNRQGGQGPYGYRWVDGRLVVDPDEARVRVRAFELFLEHRRKGTVARMLNQEGHRPRRGSEWRDVTVGRLLACTSAKGIYAVNRSEIDGAGQRVLRPEDEWQPIECEAIVSVALWDEVNAILETQAQSAKRPARVGVHTFSGLAMCGDCGGVMVVPTNNAGKYACPTPGCSRKIAVADLEGVFQDELQEFLSAREEALAEILCGDPVLAEKQRLHAELLRAIGEVEIEMSRVDQLYLKGQITTEKFGQMYQPLERRLATLKSDAAALQKEIGRLAEHAPPSDPGNGHDIRKLADNWPNLPVESRRQIAQLMIEKMTIGDGEIEVAYKFAQLPNPKDGTPIPPQHTSIPHPTTPSLKDATTSQQTTQQTQAPTNARDPGDPEWIRLPAQGRRCPLTGLSRSALNNLILPSDRNGNRPPVKSVSRRSKGSSRGIRLIHWPSLKVYLATIDD